jgi:primosomal replication protein N
MDYASFVCKGTVKRVKSYFIEVVVNKRMVRLYGQNLDKYIEVGNKVVCSGFLDRDKAYITDIDNANKGK